MTATEQRLDGPVALDRSESDVTSARLRARRQPKWIAAGILAICLGGLGAAVLYSEAAQSSDVLVLTRSVGRGETLAATDFRVARVGTLAGVSHVSSGELPTLVGKKALADLPQGSLLPAGSVGTPALATGSSQIGLKLAPGRLPTGELAQGVPVLLVPLDDARTAPGSPEPEAARPIRATVLTPPRLAPDGVATLLDIAVGADDAAVVAALSATDRVALVKVG